MAVPVLGAKVIFKAVLNSFAGIEYESVEPNLASLEYREQRRIWHDCDNLYQKVLIDPLRSGANRPTDCFRLCCGNNGIKTH